MAFDDVEEFLDRHITQFRVIGAEKLLAHDCRNVTDARRVEYDCCGLCRAACQRA